MNCKPGDLAIIVAADVNSDAWAALDIGKLVDVVGRGDTFDFDPRFHWSIRTTGSPLHCTYHPGGRQGLAHDADMPDDCLRPIRGDDAVDEMLIGRHEGATA